MRTNCLQYKRNELGNITQPHKINHINQNLLKVTLEANIGLKILDRRLDRKTLYIRTLDGNEIFINFGQHAFNSVPTTTSGYGISISGVAFLSSKEFLIAPTDSVYLFSPFGSTASIIETF